MLGWSMRAKDGAAEGVEDGIAEGVEDGAAEWVEEGGKVLQRYNRMIRWISWLKLIANSTGTVLQLIKNQHGIVCRKVKNQPV